MKLWQGLILGVLVIAVLLASTSIFIVRETELALKFRFGEIVRADYAPGLYFKLPVINKVVKFDRRILTLDSQPETFRTNEQNYVEADFFAKWRIADPARFYRATSGSEAAAMQRLLEILKAGLKAEFANRSLVEVVAAERAEIMGVMTQKANESAQEFGVEIVDVRIKQIELAPSVADNIYKRMRAERQEEAARLRAEGAEQAVKIRAEADRQHTVLLANAYSEAEKIRGAGDARATEIYASVYRRDPGFYAFYRSLQAYKSALGNGGDDVLILEPKGEFFKYFNDLPAR